MNLTQARFINGLYSGLLGRITNPVADLVVRRNRGETRTLARQMSFFSNPDILLDDKKAEASKLFENGPEILPEIKRLIPFCGEKPFEDHVVLKPVEVLSFGNDLTLPILVHPDLAKIGSITLDTILLADHLDPQLTKISDFETLITKLEYNLYNMVRRPRSNLLGIWQLSVFGEELNTFFTCFESLVSNIRMQKEPNYNLYFHLIIKIYPMYALPCIELWEKPAGIVLPFRK